MDGSLNQPGVRAFLIPVKHMLLLLSPTTIKISIAMVITLSIVLHLMVVLAKHRYTFLIPTLLPKALSITINCREIM